MDSSLIMSRKVQLMLPSRSRFSQPNRAPRVSPAQASQSLSSSLVLSESRSVDGSIMSISKSGANNWMSRRIIQISLNKLPWVRAAGRRLDLEFAHLFNNKSSIKMRDGKLWGGQNLSLILFFGSLSLYICIWIYLESDKDDGDDDDDERKKNEGLGTRGQWSESHAVVKTCLCINSFKDATPYIWQRALAMRDHPEKILVVLYIPRPYIPRVSFIYRMLILSRMATCCLFFGKSCHSQTHGESNPTHHSCLLLENLFVNYNLLFPSRCNRIPHARNKIKVKLKIK